MENQNIIFKKLAELIKKSHASYSNFNVAAIVETDLGLFNGVNIENSVFPLTMCAERIAIWSAITAGAKKINKLYLLTSDKTLSANLCGSCRQVLSEWMDEKGEIYIFDINANVTKYKINQLLPFAFGKKNLD